MTNLQHRQAKIQAKRKTTPWREFVMEMASWIPLTYTKNQSQISVFPPSGRIGGLLPSGNEMFANEREPSGDLLGDIASMYQGAQVSALTHFGVVENSNFSQYTINSRNIYLSNHCIANVENVLYSFNIKDNCSNVINSLNVVKNCDNVCNSSSVVESSSIFYSKAIYNSHNIWFSHNLIGCSECIDCSDLSNQQFCIKNIRYSPEEYQQRKSKYLNDPSTFDDMVAAMDVQSYIVNSPGCNGFDIINSENVIQGHYILNLKEGRNVLFCASEEDNESMYDVFSCGRSDNFYGASFAGTFSSHLYSCYSINTSQNCYYSMGLDLCSFCLGCIGLKNKSYCILNKQYSKEERYEKVDEIFSQMEADDTLGQFFPASMNPFYFNDTAAYLIDPSFTKEEVVSKGYLWRDEVIKVDIPEDAQVVSSSELASYESYDDQGNRTINADILKCVIQDDRGNYYRIIPMEYKFLMKHGLPLPRKHWLERMKENFRIT